MEHDELFPRQLTTNELELLKWVLPDDRPGYRRYRPCLEQWYVVAQGRRGEGHYILAPLDEFIDLESPLPQVLAYGAVESTAGSVSVTVREQVGNHIEFEIAYPKGVPPLWTMGSTRRWTYSEWLPGKPCPMGNHPVREVELKTVKDARCVLALCSADKRLWSYESLSGINHLIPHTNFYNELMLVKNIRDPKIALQAQTLFEHPAKFSADDLARAFVRYNQVRTKIPLVELATEQRQRATMFQRVRSFFHFKTV